MADTYQHELFIFFILYVAHTDDENLPVFVVIHGGAFTSGGAANEANGGTGIVDNLVSRGMVVVIIQYRVGPLGFMTMGDDVMKGNYGLWDVKTALEFIQNNIKAFGGDTERVTLFGGSAGGAIIDCLSLSPHTYGLFHNSITFSGGVVGDIFKLDMKSKTIKKAKELGIESEDSNIVKASLSPPMDQQKLVAGWFKLTPDSYDFPQLDWAPTMDNDFFNDTIENLRAAAPTKTRIMGVTADEGAAFAKDIDATENDLMQVLEKMVPEGVYDEDFGSNAGDRQIIMDHWRKKYLAVGLETEPENSLNVSFQYAIGERLFVGPVIQVADTLLYQSESKQENEKTIIYFYVFEHYNKEYASHIHQASHAFDQHFFLHNGKFTYTEDDNAVSKFCGSFAYNFASTNNPNGDGSNPDNGLLGQEWLPLKTNGSNFFMEIRLIPFMYSSDFFGGRPRANNKYRKTPNP